MFIVGCRVSVVECCAGTFEQSMGSRNRVGIGVSYRPGRLQRLAESTLWNQFLGFLKVIPSLTIDFWLSLLVVAVGS